MLDRLPDDPACVLEREPLELLAADGQLHVYRHDGFWQCADTVRDVELLRSLWDRNAAPWRIWSGTDGGEGSLADASGGMSRLAESADAARRLALEAALAAGSSHIGSSLSLIDLVTVLRLGVLWPDDRLLLSKGHAAAGFYAVLAQRRRAHPGRRAGRVLPRRGHAWPDILSGAIRAWRSPAGRWATGRRSPSAWRWPTATTTATGAPTASSATAS